MAWDEHFFPQLSDLIAYNDQLKEKMELLSLGKEQGDDLRLPDLSRIELLIQYFIPLDRLGSHLCTQS